MAFNKIFIGSVTTHMKTINKHVLNFGLLVFAGLVGFFLIMEAVGLVHNFNLRILNGVIMFTGIFLCLRTFKRDQFDRPFSYINGLGSGFFVALIASVSFALFMMTYLLLNPTFMESIRQNEPQGIYMNEAAVVMLILIEGVASGVLFTYVTMQYLKPSVMVKAKSK